MIVQIHCVNVPAALAPKAYRNYLAAFGIVAEARRVGHAYELVFDDWVGHFEWCRDHRAQRVRIGPIRHDEELAVDEAIWSAWKRRACQRHCERAFPDFRLFHTQLLS